MSSCQKQLLKFVKYFRLMKDMYSNNKKTFNRALLPTYAKDLKIKVSSKEFKVKCDFQWDKNFQKSLYSRFIKFGFFFRPYCLNKEEERTFLYKMYVLHIIQGPMFILFWQIFLACIFPAVRLFWTESIVSTYLVKIGQKYTYEIS